MKLIDTPEVVPSRLLGLARLLRGAQGVGVPRSVAAGLLMPRSLGRIPDTEDGVDEQQADRESDGAEPLRFTRVVDAALELGMVDTYSDEAGESCLRISAAAAATSSVNTIDAWSRWIARRVLTDLVEDRSRRLATVFAWMLTLPLEQMPARRADWKERFKADGFDREAFGLNSDARWDNVFYWARFFGWTWQINTVGLDPGLICSPAKFMTLHLELLPADRKLRAVDWRQSLGTAFRALDGGDLYEEVSNRVWRARGEPLDRSDRWSPGMSRAIKELKVRGVVDHDCPDDQRTFMLFHDGTKVGRVWQPVVGS